MRGLRAVTKSREVAFGRPRVKTVFAPRVVCLCVSTPKWRRGASWAGPAGGMDIDTCIWGRWMSRFRLIRANRAEARHSAGRWTASMSEGQTVAATRKGGLLLGGLLLGSLLLGRLLLCSLLGHGKLLGQCPKRDMSLLQSHATRRDEAKTGNDLGYRMMHGVRLSTDASGVTLSRHEDTTRHDET